MFGVDVVCLREVGGTWLGWQPRGSTDVLLRFGTWYCYLMIFTITIHVGYRNDCAALPHVYDQFQRHFVLQIYCKYQHSVTTQCLNTKLSSMPFCIMGVCKSCKRKITWWQFGMPLWSAFTVIHLIRQPFLWWLAGYRMLWVVLYILYLQKYSSGSHFLNNIVCGWFCPNQTYLAMIAIIIYMEKAMLKNMEIHGTHYEMIV